MTLVLLMSMQLLSRVFNILRENNPELAGDRRRTVLRPPQVLREGTKKTVFVNFMDLCKTYDNFFYILLFCFISLRLPITDPLRFQIDNFLLLLLIYGDLGSLAGCRL